MPSHLLKACPVPQADVMGRAIEWAVGIEPANERLVIGYGEDQPATRLHHGFHLLDERRDVVNMLEDLKSADSIETAGELFGEIGHHSLANVQSELVAKAFGIAASVDPRDVGDRRSALQESSVAAADIQQPFARNEAAKSIIEILAPVAILVVCAACHGFGAMKLFVKVRFAGERSRMKEPIARIMAAINFDRIDPGKGLADL
ncbi:MAG: hypothetical protein ABIU10_04230 [Sphingomicrobium sp.]